MWTNADVQALPGGGVHALQHRCELRHAVLAVAAAELRVACNHKQSLKKIDTYITSKRSIACGLRGTYMRGTLGSRNI